MTKILRQPRVSCAELSGEQAPGPAVLRGRVLSVDSKAASVTLTDETGRATVSTATPLPRPGDIIALSLPGRAVGKPTSTAVCEVLTPYRRDVPFPSPGGESYRLQRAEAGASRLARLRQRGAALRQIRAFFDDRGYLEVQTPQRVRHPGLEPQLVAERAGWGYLITSPEYQMKRLLAGGLERIYSLGSCWRGDEHGPLHLNEFCLLEWYQAHTDLPQLMAQTEQLVRRLALAINGDARISRPPHTADIGQPFVRISVAEAFERFAGMDISGTSTAADLRRRAEQAGLNSADLGDDYDDIFSRLLVEHIEPQLAQLGAVFLHSFPAPLAALARRDPTDPSVAERVELYICGVEFSNGFCELTDPDEQLERFESDRETRRNRGLPAHEIDPRFIEALREGFAPSTGNALGVDRLLMLLTGAQSVAQVVAFGPEEI